METAKPLIYFKHENYDVEIDVINERKVTLTVTDNTSRIEFSARDI
jgi:hypothetical protein